MDLHSKASLMNKRHKVNAVVPNADPTTFNHMTLTTADSESELNNHKYYKFNLGRASRKYAGSVLDYAHGMSPPLNPYKGPSPTPQLMSQNSEGANYLEQKIQKLGHASISGYTPSQLLTNSQAGQQPLTKKGGASSFISQPAGSLLGNNYPPNNGTTTNQISSVTKTPSQQPAPSPGHQLLQLQVNRQSSHSVTNPHQQFSSPGMAVGTISTHSLSPKTGIYPTTYGQPQTLPQTSVGLLAAKAKRLSGQAVIGPPPNFTSSIPLQDLIK